MSDEQQQPGAAGNDRPGLSGTVILPGSSPQYAGARERGFPERDLEGEELLLAPTSAPRRAENPYLVYLATVAEGESRRAMAGCLDRIAGLWAVQLDLEPPHPAGQHFAWASLRYKHTAAIHALLQAQTRPDGTPWAPAYRNKHFAALRMTLKQAFLLGQMSADDYLRAREIKNVTNVRVRPGRMISPDEHRKIVEGALADGSLMGLRDAALLETLHSTGCRRQELAHTTRDAYDPGTRSLVVTGKGGKQREVYLTETAAAQLGAWLVTARPRGPLFPAFDRWGNLTGEQMTSNGVGRVVTRHAEQAGSPDLTAHDYRRDFASRLLEQGTDLVTVQELLGHASASTTAGYDRRPAAARRAAVDRLNRT